MVKRDSLHPCMMLKTDIPGQIACVDFMNGPNAVGLSGVLVRFLGVCGRESGRCHRHRWHGPALVHCCRKRTPASAIQRLALNQARVTKDGQITFMLRRPKRAGRYRRCALKLIHSGWLLTEIGSEMRLSWLRRGAGQNARLHSNGSPNLS